MADIGPNQVGEGCPGCPDCQPDPVVLIRDRIEHWQSSDSRMRVFALHEMRRLLRLIGAEGGCKCGLCDRDVTRHTPQLKY